MDIMYPDTYQIQHRWDTDTWVHTVFNLDGSVASESSFTQADLDAWLVARSDAMAQARTVERQVYDALEQDLLDLNTIIQDTSNATINANPAPYIKALARVTRHLIRMAIRRFDAVA